MQRPVNVCCGGGGGGHNGAVMTVNDTLKNHETDSETRCDEEKLRAAQKNTI